jgi:hypothetical protein
MIFAFFFYSSFLDEVFSTLPAIFSPLPAEAQKRAGCPSHPPERNFVASAATLRHPFSPLLFP